MKELKVLLVEDNEADIVLTSEMLNRVGVNMKLTIARDGAEAIDMIAKSADENQSNRPDLVFLDINLPKVDGKEVLSFIKSNESYNSIVVAMYTSSNLESDIIFCHKNDADIYLRKPNSMALYEVIIDTVKRFIDEKFPNSR